jgi:hypothetical protein
MTGRASAPVLQDDLPFPLPWTDPRSARLPGIQPATEETWLLRDPAYAGQMALRDDLIASRPADVLALQPEGRAAAGELLDTLLAWLATQPGHVVTGATVIRPDGVTVPVDRDDPLRTAGRLVQEDLCLMQAQGDEAVLTGAVLCFPASWTLAEKIGRPMTRIHDPVREYDADVARRVQRLIDAIRPGQVLWRANFNVWADARLFAPRRETDPRADRTNPRYLRSERQTLRRLPVSGAVVFAIHTFMIPLEQLPAAARSGLQAEAAAKYAAD